MDIQDIRRARLRLWLEGRTAPTKEKSYFSQLASGTASFGERAARRIERDYGMGEGYLDQPLPSPAVKPEAPDTQADTASNKSTEASAYNIPQSGADPIPMGHHVGGSKNFRRVYVIGTYAQGGLPERLWSDGDHLAGVTDEYAEVATIDPHAYICPVVGDSMYPRFMPGEYVLVEPGTEPQIEGTVLIRLTSGKTMLKRLLSHRDGHVRLGSWNDPIIHTFRDDEVTWMHYVAHSVPPEKIKRRF